MRPARIDYPVVQAAGLSTTALADVRCTTIVRRDSLATIADLTLTTIDAGKPCLQDPSEESRFQVGFQLLTRGESP